MSPEISGEATRRQAGLSRCLLLFTGNPLAGPPKVLAGVASIPASAGIQEAARVCRLSRSRAIRVPAKAGTTKRTLSPINARAPVYWFSSPGVTLGRRRRGYTSSRRSVGRTTPRTNATTR